MTEYVLTFLAGMAVGVGGLLAHQYSVRQAVGREQYRARRQYDVLARENDDLRVQVQDLQRCQDSRDSYRQGMADGIQRGRNQSNLEVLEGTLGRNARVGSARR